MRELKNKLASGKNTKNIQQRIFEKMAQESWSFWVGIQNIR